MAWIFHHINNIGSNYQHDTYMAYGKILTCQISVLKIDFKYYFPGGTTTF